MLKTKMKTLFWRLNGKLGLRITTHAKPVNITVPQEIWERIESSPGATWTGGKNLFEGPGSARINSMLFSMLSDVKMTYSLLMGAGAEVTAGAVRDVYKDMIAGRYAFDSVGLSACMRERSVKRVRMSILKVLNWSVKNSVRCTDSTIEQKGKLVRNVERFLQETGLGDIQADDFTVPILNRFLDYMRERGLKDSYINEHIVLIRAAIKQAVGRDYVSENHLVDYEFHFIRDKHTAYITKEQLQWLEETDFTKIVAPEFGVILPEKPTYAGPYFGEKMQEVVDLFIFCCYTAFHYCDREELNEGHTVKRGDSQFLVKVRKKTKRFGATATMKLAPKAIEIINKYGGVSNLPKMDYMTNTGYLYRLGKLMGLPFTLRTGHARNTFVFMAFNEWGFDAESISKTLGHKSTKILDLYGEVTIRRIEKMMIWK